MLWSCYAVAQAADPDMYWFKNETECGDAKVTVRSYCEVSQHTHAAEPHNTGCTEQELLITQPGKTTVTRDLLEHEPVGNDFHVASALRCVMASKQRYLVIRLDTGGSCDSCEISAILTLDGHWKRYGKQWQSTPVLERRAIRLREPAWMLEPSYMITNVMREEQSKPCSEKPE